ncbi:uncharacterized protein [Zea mays]|uniref:Uncharacterized protein n=1 Tax=Zea mays TaxID=4577 RepID=K7US01_MAIZE|nr:uncharacterized protein LOC103654895 [Zea mays]AQK60467.1 hypothetical protein ZEAMMB73_Zm00001d053824 [Zea mays]|eukprot:XP_008679932.1 uncharacterized protein LOC103654895 [Zea mays]
MDRRHRAVPYSARQQQQRFLRPGALARLRDSRIVARSVRSSACLLLPRSAPPSPSPAPPVVAADELAAAPRFLGTTSGSGRYPLRRRVVAARGVAFSPSSP